MAKLKITKNHQLVQEIQLDPGQTYLGGRGETCQIKLDAEPGISRQHFQINFREQKWMLEVLSKYGELYIQDEKAATQFALTENLTFQIPPYEFTFGEGSIQNPIGGGGSTADSDPSDKTAVAAIPNSTFLKLLDHKGTVRQLFRLEGEAWVAGRDVTCSIFIDNPRVSRKQFEIYRENQSFYIRDLGSANGTLVNGHQISTSEWLLLNSADVITVVDWTLHFEVHDAHFKERVEQAQPLNNEANAAANSSGNGEQDEFIPTNYSPIPEPDPNAYQEQNQDFYPASMMGEQGSQQGVPFPGYQSPSVPPTFTSEGKFANFKSKLNPVRIFIVLLILGVAYYLIFEDQPSANSGNAKTVKSKSAFDNLSPEDQQYVQQCYNAADQYIRQQLFQNALDEIIKLESKIKYYQDSKAIKEIAQNALATIALQREEEKAQKEKAEMELKIQRQIEICEKIMNPDKITLVELEGCLSPVLSLNPDHPEIVALKRKAEAMVADREVKKAKRAAYQEEIKKLKSLYEKAQTLDRAEKFREAIKAYEVVADSKLADPNSLKSTAKARVAAILKKLDDDQKEFLEKAEQLIKEGKYRDAVVFLQKALKMNPDSEPIKLKMHFAMTELHKQMQVIFQDSILEESVGDVDAAKQKWRKIMEQSLPAEEYFEKARLKLRKYGVI